MTNSVDFYAKFISEQLKEEYKENTTKEDPKVTKKVGKALDMDEHGHVATHGSHHTYYADNEPPDFDTPVPYATHDTSTGKTHRFNLPGDKLKTSQVHDIMNKAVPGGVSKEHAKVVTKEHNYAFTDRHDG